MNKFGEIVMNKKRKWYSEYPKEKFPCSHSVSVIDVLKLKNQAKEYLDEETATFKRQQLKIKDSESEWLRTASTEGTHADKIAATIIFIQDNPKYNLIRLSNLIVQIKGLKYNVSNSLITSLRDLFLFELLHPQYKLLKFEEQPLDTLNLSNENGFSTKDTRTKNILAHWYFEDQLRDQYNKFLQALFMVASDPVEVIRENAISILTDLLISNPEQEDKILECLVNKIGDPQAKVASKVVFCLNKVLKNHSNMKLIILKEVEKLLFRPNIAPRTQYYAIGLLTHFILNKGDSETATNLINVYFAFFKACMKKGEPESRMMAAILTGVNRAYRFADLDNVKLNEHINSVYKVIHSGSFNVSLSALGLLHQVVNNNPQQAQRFYNVLYRQLLDPQIGVANQRAIFLNLLYKVMKNDKNTSRLYTFMKRILQVSLYFSPRVICAILYVISHILSIRNDLKQVLRYHINLKKENQNGIEKAENNSNIEDNNIISIKKLENKQSGSIQILTEDSHALMLPNVIVKNSSDPTYDICEKNIEIENYENMKTIYNPFCINPSESGALNSPLVELISLSNHFHPSVSLFAKNILTETTINYTGDPLEDLSLIRFLDRYVFKNPKKHEKKKIANELLDVRVKYMPKGLRALPVYSQVYLNEREDQIPVDELFLYQYLRKNRKGQMKSDESDCDTESIDSDEFDHLLVRLSGNKDIETLDFAGNIQLTKKKKHKLQDIYESENDEDEEIENSDDVDSNHDNDSVFDETYESEEMVFNEDDNINEGISLKKFMKSNHRDNNSHGNKHMLKKRKKTKVDNIFMSAEEFSRRLEEQDEVQNEQNGDNHFRGVDKVSMKQLVWERRKNANSVRKFHGKVNKKFKIDGEDFASCNTSTKKLRIKDKR